jgi:hypothetical protein
MRDEGSLSSIAGPEAVCPTVRYELRLAQSARDHVTMGIVLICKPIVVSFGRQQSEQPATARVREHARCPTLGVESWSPRGVQTPQKAPVASTGVHVASC